jgi:branched-chain amino acid transport system substrate-binding protein
VPVVGGDSGLGPDGGDPNWFSAGPNLQEQYAAMVDQAKTDGKKKIGIMYCAEAPACKQVVGLLDVLAKQAGLGTGSVAVSGSATSYTAPCLAMKDQGVDALIPGLAAPVAARVIDQCAQQGYSPKLYDITGGYTPVWLSDPKFTQMVLVSDNANFTDTSISGVAAFHDAMQKYASSVNLSQLPYDAWFPWVGGMLFEAAAKAATITPTSTPADVKNGLYALKDETLSGVAPPLNYAAGKAPVFTCHFTIGISGGSLHSTNGGQPICLPPSTAALVHVLSKPAA